MFKDPTLNEILTCIGWGIVVTIAVLLFALLFGWIADRAEKKADSLAKPKKSKNTFRNMSIVFLFAVGATLVSCSSATTDNIKVFKGKIVGTSISTTVIGHKTDPFIKGDTIWTIIVHDSLSSTDELQVLYTREAEESYSSGEGYRKVVIQ